MAAGGGVLTTSSESSLLGIDPVGTAGGLGAIAGAVSVVWPFFDGMAAALAALAVVGWLSRALPRSGAGPPALRLTPRVMAIVSISVVLGWAYFLLAPGAWSLARGLALGAVGGAVGWVGRRRTAFGEGTP